MRRGSLVAAVLLVLIVAAMTYPGAVLVAMVTRLTPPPAIALPASPGALPWLHVDHPGGPDIPYIANPQGRRVILRGVVAAGLVDYWTGTDLNVQAPVVIRMKGNNEERGKEMLRQSGLNFITADNMTEAAKKVVAASREARTAPG